MKLVDINIIVPKMDELKGIVKGLFNKDLASCDKLQHPNLNSNTYIFEPGENNMNYRIAITMMNGQNNIRAAISTMQSAKLVKPKIMLLAGTALGKQDNVSLGDVVFSSNIKDLSEKRYEKDKAHNVRGLLMCEAFNTINEIDKHIDFINDKNNGDFRVRKGDLTSGNDYVGSDPNGLIWEYNIKSIAYDMESVGFGEVCNLLNLPWMVARVISDFGTKDSISISKKNNNQDRINKCINLGKVIKRTLEVGALDAVFMHTKESKEASFEGKWQGYMGYRSSEGKNVIYSEQIDLQRWQKGFVGYVEGKKVGTKKRNSKNMRYLLEVSDAELSPISGVWKSENNENNKNVGSLVGNVRSEYNTHYMTDIEGVWLGSSSTDGIRQGVFYWTRVHEGENGYKKKLNEIKKIIENKLTNRQ